MIGRLDDPKELRAWALQCEIAAARDMCSERERERLIRMKGALLDLAQQAEWLKGKEEGGAIIEFNCAEAGPILGSA